MGRRALIGLFTVLCGVLSGCAQLVDSDAVRVCRSLLPILDRDSDRIDVLQTLVTGSAGVGSAGSGEEAVAIDYRPAGRSGSSPIRRVSCLFAPLGNGVVADPLLGIAAQLVDVVSDDGAIGPLRLHLLKQNWIARGAAAAADPAPYATVGPVPEVRLGAAVVVQNALAALPLIAIYSLLAAAYALIYGLTGRINLAFGELTMLAGYGAFLGFSAMPGAWGMVAAMAGAIVLGLYAGVTHGAAMGRWVFAPLAARPGQHVLIATIGLSLFWSELVRLTQGSGNRWISPILNRPLALARSGDFIVTVTPMALLLPAVAGMAAAGLLALMSGSRIGRRWRAFADDPIAAQLLGVDPQRLILTTMTIAAGAAALAGVLTTFYYGGVGFAGGQLVGLKALIAAVIGGIGSVRGALLGGIALGVFEALWSALFTIESRDIAEFVVLVVWLAARGEGREWR